MQTRAVRDIDLALDESAVHTSRGRCGTRVEHSVPSAAAKRETPFFTPTRTRYYERSRTSRGTISQADQRTASSSRAIDIYGAIELRNASWNLYR